MSKPERRPDTQYRSTLTCPHCGHRATETMSATSCAIVYDCSSCGERIVPEPGSCCVFCSYGDVVCPPRQEGRSC